MTQLSQGEEEDVNQPEKRKRVNKKAAAKKLAEDKV